MPQDVGPDDRAPVLAARLGTVPQHRRGRLNDRGDPADDAQPAGEDPATIAGVFDTMLSDLMGNLIYLGLATLLIAWLVR